MNDLIFREEQRFDQWWMRLSLIAPPFILIAVFWPMIDSQLLHGVPMGHPQLSDAHLILLVLGITLGVTILTTIPLLLMKLVTEVRPDGLYVRFIPFHFKERRYGWADIRSFEPVTYSPLRDYGGWGLRRGRSGWAFNVKGNRGVLLIFGDGKTLLIGSQAADELAAAMLAAREPGKDR